MGRQSRTVVYAPSRRRLSRPAAEGPREGARLGIAEGHGNLAERDPGLTQQLTRDLEPRLVDQTLEARTLGLQMPAQGAAMNGKAICNRRGRAPGGQDLGSQHAAQVLLPIARSGGFELLNVGLE